MDRDAALTTVREAYIAATADRRVRESRVLTGCLHIETLTLDEFSTFARTVWRAETRIEPLYISAIEAPPTRVDQSLADAAAAARWFSPPSFARSGELAGTHGPVAYIDVRAEGLRRPVALHEIAHLIVDERGSLGHGQAWADAYLRLIDLHLGSDVATVWAFEFSWWSEKAREKIAENPAWLEDLLPDTTD